MQNKSIFFQDFLHSLQLSYDKIYHSKLGNFYKLLTIISAIIFYFHKTS